MKAMQAMSWWFLLCLFLCERNKGWGAAAAFVRVTMKNRKFWFGFFQGPRFYLAA